MRGKYAVKPFDYVIVLAVIALAAITFILFSINTKTNGELKVLVHSESGDAFYDISKDQIIDVSSKGYNIKIKIKNKSVSIVETDCPNQYCKEAGKISKNGQIIICAPAVVYIKVEVAEVNKNDPDIIIG